MTPRIVLAFASLATLLAFALSPREASAADWVINSFEVQYVIDDSGQVRVTEDIRVDFGETQKHGIFRDMPVRYRYDDDNDRLISVTDVTVDDGADPHPFELISTGPNLRIKIGDPDVTIAGEQRYRIQYTLLNALNANPTLEDGTRADWDEFYWNVTGDEWDATILEASANVQLPGSGIQSVTCFEGQSGSIFPCEFTESASSAHFEASTWLGPGSGLTIVVATRKGLIDVGPPFLVPAEQTDWKKFKDFWDFSPWVLALTSVLGVASFVALFRLWWVEGRDRWYGDLYQLHDGNDGSPGVRRPMFAREAVVVEYAPPDLERRGRRMRPAEIGLLLDEKADVLDVSATIVDLAVRKHLKITETKSGGLFGLFKSTDYELERLPDPQDELLPYEQTLKTGLFDGKQIVKMSSLKNKFYKDLERVQNALYKQAVQDKFFASDPGSVRNTYRVAGLAVAAVGVALSAGLGFAFGGAVIGIPIALAGLILFALAHLMPRRTARGRVLYRRALGFRKFMTAAETERQRFAERSNIFHEYLPYAMVYGCVDRWAKAFEDLGLAPSDPYWYSGTVPFRAAYFAGTVSTFSSSISSTMASTPGSSGGSGSGGGGSSGGGGGGGGGGSW